MTSSSFRCDARLGWTAACACALAAAATPVFPWAGAAALGAVAALWAGLALRAAPPAPPPAADAARDELEATARRVTALLDGAFRGDLEARVTPAPRTEPSRALALAANDFLDVSDAFVRESRASLEELAAGRRHRRFLSRGLDGAHARAADVITRATIDMARKDAGFRRLTGAFETEVMAVAERLGGSAAGLRENASQMADSVSRAGGDAAQIEARARAAADSVRGVAAAAAQLGEAVGAITARTAASRDMADRAVAEVDATEASIATLLTGADRIGRVVELIHSVSEQTSLLAVNAMIEAARSGRAGAGFAVVAREVQVLAGKTKDATRAIEAQVREAQAAAERTAQAVAGIRATIAEMARHAAETAADASRQTGSVAHIAASMGEVSGGAAEVGRLVGGVAEAVGAASGAADAVRLAADDLLDRSELLGEELRRYLTHASAA
jgi:methyl-accepting chemotaxis protein